MGRRGNFLLSTLENHPQIETCFILTSLLPLSFFPAATVSSDAGPYDTTRRSEWALHFVVVYEATLRVTMPVRRSVCWLTIGGEFPFPSGEAGVTVPRIRGRIKGAVKRARAL